MAKGDLRRSEKNLDQIDRRILQILTRDSRTPFTRISKELSVSEGTVRQRVNRLIVQGVIKRFTVETAELERIRAVTLLSAMPETSTSEIAEEVRRVLGVERLYELSGEYDLLAMISGENIESINACIDKIRHAKGISKTNTLIMLKTWD